MSGLLDRPADARCLLVLGHGAGAGMEHPFMASLADGLGTRGIATLRYQFPYMERGGRRPDPRGRLVATIEAASTRARELAGDLPLLAGGKSMGGRMTSHAAAEGRLPGVAGIVFFGFPLHGAGKPPSTDRAAHLPEVSQPMLFLQGTRDKLADLDLLRPVVDALPRARLHVVDGADHGFHVLKRSGRTDEAVMDELVDVADAWITEALET